MLAVVLEIEQQECLSGVSLKSGENDLCGEEGKEGPGVGISFLLATFCTAGEEPACLRMDLEGNQQSSFNYAGICYGLANFSKVTGVVCAVGGCQH